jgi:hypothetical protein
VTMRVQGNILDEVHDTLDPTVFDDPGSSRPELKPQHRDWIVSTIHSVFGHNGYDNSAEWLDLVLTGSLTTYQYSEDSDVDVSLFVNAAVFPEWSRAELIGIVVENIDGNHLPGTTHPMQCFVVPQGITKEHLYAPGMRSGYDILTGRWLVPPEHSRSHNVPTEYNAQYVYAMEQADKMEALLNHEPEKAKLLWHQIHARRRRDMAKGKGDYALSNIVYKYLANQGLLPEIADLTGEYIAKTAGIPGWKPGEYGKFLAFPDGSIHHWRTYPSPNDPYDGRPTHADYVTHVAPQLRNHYYDDTEYDKNEWTPGWIGPDGGVFTLTSDYYKGIHAGRAKKVVESLPGTFFAGNLGDAPVYKQAKLTPWELDHDAVEQARQHLGLQMPVNVNLVKGETAGQYNGVADGAHQVNLVSWLRPESASKQLWHELAHAKQLERDPDSWFKQLAEYKKTYALGHDAYVNHPWEQEARTVGDQHPFPLVREAIDPRITDGTTQPEQEWSLSQAQ